MPDEFNLLDQLEMWGFAIIPLAALAVIFGLFKLIDWLTNHD